MKLHTFKADGGKPEITDIPADQMERAEELRNELIEKAAENDETLMELFFENDGLTEDEMRSGITAGLIERGVFPVFCVSAKNNMGVGRLLEFITNVVPSADRLPGGKTKDGKVIAYDTSGPTSVFVFKTSVESHIGEVNFFKVMSGKLTEGMDLTNLTTQNKERFSQLFASFGKNRTKVTEMFAGDIGCTVKMKNTNTNNTLSTARDEYERIPFPEPKFRTAIKPLNEGDEEKLGEALNRLHDEDPTVIVEYSKELRQIILHGQGEHHLNIVKWHLDNVFKVETNFVAPRIPYRETITKVAQADYRHKKQSGGSGPVW